MHPEGASPMTGLLISVRDADEAEAALAGGADLIDVKEPAHGSLGRADAATLRAVLQRVNGRRPVSAALGELTEELAPLPDGLRYAKWGLAGCAGLPWRQLLTTRVNQLPKGCDPVAVAYADWQRANAPPPAEVCAFATASRRGAFLLDTWAKDGTTLVDWLPVQDLAALIQSCRDAGVRVALAGSLGPERIAQLLPLQPDWFAVRGAACHGGSRVRGIDPRAVRRLRLRIFGRFDCAGSAR